ncbi:MAG TPA: AAA domain-containing protein [Clostridia bacterium]|nr:AAA domain-containing protein [Clostridia bacterium]
MKIEDLKEKLFMDNYMDIAIEEYLKFKGTKDYGEEYKKEGLSELNDYLKDKRITAENIVEIVKYFQSKNPQNGSFVDKDNLDDLLKYAEKRAVEVAELFNYLYEESADLKDRIERFVNTAKNYNASIKLGTPLFGYLLAGFNREKYPLYKDSAFKEFLDSFGISETLADVATKYFIYYEVCSILLDYFKQKSYIKNPNMLDAQDFIYCMTNYKELYVKVSVKYLYKHSKVLDSFNKDINVFLNYINKLDKTYLQALYDRYKADEKVNRIRARVCEKIINDGQVTAEDLENIKNEVASGFKEDILKSWNNFRILFPLYYEIYKERVNIEIRKIYNSVKSIFDNFKFKENKYISDFYGPQNFGGSRCWFAIYPEKKKTHKEAAQLFFTIGGDETEKYSNISYGLYIGDNINKILEEKGTKEHDDIETIDNPNDFTYKKMVKKFIEVFDRFKKINDIGDDHGTDSGDTGGVIDFEKEVKITSLFFEDAEVLSKRISNALKSGKHIILVGPPGTGKSKLAKEICKSYGVKYEMVTAMSDWSTYDTIGGYKPDRDGTLYFDEGVFLRLFKNKKNSNYNIKWLIIDEINRADIDKAFGALFSALTGDKIILSFKSKSGENIVIRPEEDDEEEIEIQEHGYVIPKDFRIIGTMNTYDKTSLYEMSYAFMRRFAFIPVGVPKNIDKDLVAKYLNIWGIEDKSINNVDLKEGLAEVWNIINKYRIVGPAIIEDIARYVSVEGDYTSAVILYVLPQFEGIMENDIRKFAEELYKSSIRDFARQKDRLDGFISDFFGIKM